jgi:hypothetical protein
MCERYPFYSLFQYIQGYTAGDLATCSLPHGDAGLDVPELGGLESGLFFPAGPLGKALYVQDGPSLNNCLVQYSLKMGNPLTLLLYGTRYS